MRVNECFFRITSITLLPFGMSQTRKKLQRVLEKRIADNDYIQMQFYFFLVSFLGCTDVKRLFRKHKLMKLVNETSAYYDYSWDAMNNYLNIGDRVYHSYQLSDTTTVRTMDDMFSPKSDHSMHYGLVLDQINDQQSNGNGNDNMANNEQMEVVYSEKDPVKLFRLALDKNACVGFKIVVSQRKRFYDPINYAKNKYVQQLRVRKRFTSNSRPYLIDCFVSDGNVNDRIEFNSSYILKQGDDLRKDAAVLKMFEFMNQIWKSNGLKYKKSIVAAKTYKCIPLGPDVGIIEEIGNCIELNKVSSIKDTLKHAKNVHLYNQLIASSAGAFIAAFVWYVDMFLTLLQTKFSLICCCYLAVYATDTMTIY